jgi:hypothetical protein
LFIGRSNVGRTSQGKRLADLTGADELDADQNPVVPHVEEQDRLGDHSPHQDNPPHLIANKNKGLFY